MTTRRFLIIAPLVVVAVLLQSYFWVPTYEEQTRGMPERLEKFIAASNGDATVLNPILSADTASSSIESMVFEGLLDRDENLRFRGRLARSWEISENAYFYVNADAVFRGGEALSAAQVAHQIRTARDFGRGLPDALRRSLDRIETVAVEPPRRFTSRLQTESGRSAEFVVSAPARIRLELSEVDPDLFENLSLLLGDRYFSSFSALRHVRTDAGISVDQQENIARRILPAVEHNPILLFRLRAGVRFHDGHVFDADDVKFTYDAIMDPENLSPRTADY